MGWWISRLNYLSLHTSVHLVHPVSCSGINHPGIRPTAIVGTKLPWRRSNLGYCSSHDVGRQQTPARGPYFSATMGEQGKPGRHLRIHIDVPPVTFTITLLCRKCLSMFLPTFGPHVSWSREKKWRLPMQRHAGKCSCLCRLQHRRSLGRRRAEKAGGAGKWGTRWVRGGSPGRKGVIDRRWIDLGMDSWPSSKLTYDRSDGGV